MGTLTATINIYFSQPWWLVLLILLVPMVWLGKKNMASFSRTRMYLALLLRSIVIIILVFLLGRLMIARVNEKTTLVTVIDRSLSIPENIREPRLDTFSEMLMKEKPQSLKDQQDSDKKLAVIDVAEFATISSLSSNELEVRERNTTLTGTQSKLSDGIQMAMAIAPPDTATRILLLSDGNETAGDLKEAARIAATNRIPIDVLPIRYNYANELIFRNLSAPIRARKGQTVPLRFILNSTSRMTGKLSLTLNGKMIDISPDSEQVTADVELKAGTNVKTISLPLDSLGMHEFRATFVPDDPGFDAVSENNQATALTFVAGPGKIKLYDTDGKSGQPLQSLVSGTDMEVEYFNISEFPTNLARLMDADAVILCNTSCDNFTYEQQEMIVRYVNDIGGGLIMIGGDQAFGAGGWIGSPVAEILPIDCDPPQKKQMPKGALVLIMHACEMPNGNLWGKRTAIAAVRALSRRDLVGVVDYSWNGPGSWVYPLSPAGDKSKVVSAINGMQMGDMPDFHTHMQQAYDALVASDAGQKHVIIISDGDPQPPSQGLLNKYRQAKISVTGVAVFPHSPSDVQSLITVAQKTGGRFYNVSDPQKLPGIFIKEAQVVRRALIDEESFTPQFAYSLHEITKGISGFPALDGYVLSGPKEGLSQILLKTEKADPLLAVMQSGLGKTVAFTSGADTRWAGSWQNWPGNSQFWEQVIRWAAKPSQSTDCEVFADVRGRDVTIQVEATDKNGASLQLTNIDAQVITPDMSSSRIAFSQTGPGQYNSSFQSNSSGSYILNLRYKKPGSDEVHFMQTPVTIPFAPEFRDLSDNSALLEQVSSITGGRVLDFDPAATNLYEHEGLKFPETKYQVTKWLMISWIVFFLLDVATRRVAIDFVSASKKIMALISHRKEIKSDETIDRLQQARNVVRKSYEDKAGKSMSAKRYTAADSAKDQPSADLPQADVEKPAEKPRPQKSPEKAEKKTEPEKPDHIQQLLRVKRKNIKEEE